MTVFWQLDLDCGRHGRCDDSVWDGPAAQKLCSVKDELDVEDGVTEDGAAGNGVGKTTLK
jgi:hypothetical protein